jgi:hypothetical protein
MLCRHIVSVYFESHKKQFVDKIKTFVEEADIHIVNTVFYRIQLRRSRVQFLLFTNLITSENV